MIPKNNKPAVEPGKRTNKKPLRSYFKANVASFAVVGSLLSFVTFQVGTDVAQSLEASQVNSVAVVNKVSGQLAQATAPVESTPTQATTSPTGSASQNFTTTATTTGTTATPAAASSAAQTQAVTTPAPSATTAAATTAAASNNSGKVTVSQVTRAAAPVVTKRS
jgi:hypothetical protein